ncbi:MAG TPA: sigma-70 family RNA polymerase sigma factor [Rubrobacter sp.]|jgi:RNA polymerase sigma-70 factor (ECF subfamily)|nr:sigma-70 family RNA polymerase sigma factor [Rubrobacter sp.]
MSVTAGDVLEGERESWRLRPVTSGQMDALSDEQLMTRLEGPEVEAAIARLYNRYARTVFGVGLKMLGDRSLAEELTQEVFLKVWRSSGTFDPARGGFSTWLFRVTRSVALDLHRRRARRIRPVPEGDTHLAAVRDDSAGPQEIVDEAWLSWRVSRALDVLEAPYREVIELAYFGGFSQREISVRTGIPLGTVKTRTARAFRRLREELALADAWRVATR